MKMISHRKTGPPPASRILGFIALVFLILQLAGCSGFGKLDPKKVNPKDVPNYGVVKRGRIYRSGQPTPAGFEYLFKNGMKTIINLRTSHWDAQWIPENRLPYYHEIMIRDHTAPTEEQMKAIVAIVADPQSWPVLIHCQKGKGRAGVVVAALRYSLDGWSDKKVMREAERFHDGEALNPIALAFLERWKEYVRSNPRR
jgi:protein tyrosine/serine phosphatase